MIVLISLCSDKMAQKNPGADPSEQRSDIALSVAPNASKPTGRARNFQKIPSPVCNNIRAWCQATSEIDLQAT
jgi:hypothetical protein